MKNKDIVKYFPHCESLEEVVEEIKQILAKYIEHVGACEGITFLEHRRNDWKLFTELELDFLDYVDSEGIDFDKWLNRV